MNNEALPVGCCFVLHSVGVGVRTPPPAHYPRDLKVIVEKPSASTVARGGLALVCGRDILTNEQINILSVRTRKRPLAGRYRALCVCMCAHVRGGSASRARVDLAMYCAVEGIQSTRDPYDICGRGHIVPFWYHERMTQRFDP